MRVDHRRAHVLVAQQLLYRPNLILILQQVSGKGVAKRMAACRLGDPCFQPGFLEAPGGRNDSCRWRLRFWPVILAV